MGVNARPVGTRIAIIRQIWWKWKPSAPPPGTTSRRRPSWMPSPWCVGACDWCQRVFHCPQSALICRNSLPPCTTERWIPSPMPLELRKVQLKPVPAKRRLWGKPYWGCPAASHAATPPALRSHSPKRCIRGTGSTARSRPKPLNESPLPPAARRFKFRRNLSYRACGFRSSPRRRCYQIPEAITKGTCPASASPRCWGC